MSPPKTKKSSKKEEINNYPDLKKLTRQPLYPDLQKEKENIGFVSSGDSPEKAPYNCSPMMLRKSNSASSTDSMPDIPGSPKLRNERLWQIQMNEFKNNEDSDEDMETENCVDSNYYHNQAQEESEFSLEDRKQEMDIRKRKSNQPKISSPKTEPPASTSNSSHSFLNSKVYLPFVLCILVISILVFFYIYYSRYPGTPSKNDKFNASSLLNIVKSKYKNQPRLTFRIIDIALKNVLVEQPEAPAIILLLATNGSETVCRKLAQSLVDSLSVPDHTVRIFGKDYKHENPNDAKKKIDKTISDALKTDQLGSVLIEDLDQIPGKAAVILYKFSDHENASFKKAVFVMTVNYSKEISNYSDAKVWDKAAYDHLLSVWTDVGIDQATPLLTRLTVNVAVIRA